MKVEGEKFDIIDVSIEDEKSISDEQINEKYLKGEIRIITEQARYPLDSIRSMIDSLKYNLNPEYQRRKRWSVEQQSKLIESFIINVPIPPIFLYEVEYAQYEVMDGLQRLTAIDEFYKGNYALEGLEEWKELNGKNYFQLPSKVKEGIDRRYLSSIILLNETAKSKEQADFLKEIVFGRLNSGGDKLTPQETRNALYKGKFNSFCIELSRNDDFRKLWGFPLIEIDEKGEIKNEQELLSSGDSYRKMEDVELVLRYFAYRHVDKLSSFKSQEKFIDEFLNQANHFPDETIDKLRTIFEKTVSIIYFIFGEKAFYMPDGVRNKTTPTKTIYDPLMQSISKIIDKEHLLKSKADILRINKYKEKSKLKISGRDGEVELFDGKYNSRNNVESRIKYFDEYFYDFLNS